MRLGDIAADAVGAVSAELRAELEELNAEYTAKRKEIEEG